MANYKKREIDYSVEHFVNDNFSNILHLTLSKKD